MKSGLNLVYNQLGFDRIQGEEYVLLRLNERDVWIRVVIADKGFHWRGIWATVAARDRAGTRARGRREGRVGDKEDVGANLSQLGKEADRTRCVWCDWVGKWWRGTVGRIDGIVGTHDVVGGLAVHLHTWKRLWWGKEGKEDPKVLVEDI